MFIFYIQNVYFVYTKHQVFILICNENIEISVANLMIQYRGLFPLGNKYFGVFVMKWVKLGKDRIQSY